MRVIRIINLSYTYPDGTVALRNINLQVFSGESVGIIGPNGAGKSTLLLHLNGILRGKGEIEVLGEIIGDGNLQKIRRKVGMVFQNPDDQLFMPTVFDDVAFGPLNMGLDKEEIQLRVREALKEVGMEEYLGRCTHHLSLGEKRKISLATILSMETEILVLDEPSSNLDPKARSHLISFLKNFKLTKIIASHDLELILKLCSRVVILDMGKIVADGEPKELLSDKLLMESHGLEVPLSLRRFSS